MQNLPNRNTNAKQAESHKWNERIFYLQTDLVANLEFALLSRSNRVAERNTS